MFQEIDYQEWQIYSTNLFIPTEKRFSKEHDSVSQLSFDSSLYSATVTNFWLIPFCVSSFILTLTQFMSLSSACNCLHSYAFIWGCPLQPFSFANNLTSGDWEKEYIPFKCIFTSKNLLLSNLKPGLFILCLTTCFDLFHLENCLIPKFFPDTILLAVFCQTSKMNDLYLMPCTLTTWFLLLQHDKTHN